MSHELFPLMNFTGNPYQLGFQHGTQMKDQIEKTIIFYRRLFNRPEEQILKRAKNFIDGIERFDYTIVEEIRGIAEGSGIDPLWIYALNSRSEILSMFISECTAIYSTHNRLLAQNWDWAKEMEKLAYIAKLKDEEERSILMMTEPGIVGKIGFNSSGLGVTLNFLKIDELLEGVPIHVILRGILNCKTLEEAMDKLEGNYLGKAGNIIIGTNKGDFVNIEFAGNEHYITKNRDYMLHTNHYLGNGRLNTIRPDEELASSFARYQRSDELITNLDNIDIDDMKMILADNKGNLPICRKYLHDEVIGNIGTVCSIIMDLKYKKMQITRGNPFSHGYTEFKL